MTTSFNKKKISEKNLKDFKEIDLLIILIEKKLNNLIFKKINLLNLSPEEISEKLELEDIKPTLYSDKLLTSFLLESINYEGKKEKKDFKLSLKDLKVAINQAKKNKILERWGDEKLLVTKKFLDVVKHLDEPFDINIEFKETESENFLYRKINSFCPHCKKSLEITDQEGIYDLSCSNCKRDIKLISGKIKKIRGRLNSPVTYGTEQISITLSIKNKEMPINFSTKMRLILATGDKIGLLYTKNKKLFSKEIDEKLKLIDNFTTNQGMRV